MRTLCSSLFLSHDQIPNKKQLKEEGLNQVASLRMRSVMAAGTGGACSHCTHGQEAEDDECLR